MNKFSSILQWIGNTIGANPNTLTTTAKTLVGAINEIVSTINGLSKKVNGIRCVNLDSIPTSIPASSTGEFDGTYRISSLSYILNPVDVYLTGMNVRSTGTNYSRVVLYGGLITKEESGGYVNWNLSCYGRNISTSASADSVSVRFRLLILPHEDDE